MLWRKIQAESYDPDDFQSYEDDDFANGEEDFDPERDRKPKENSAELCWKKALYLLARQDYTTVRLRQKLARDFSIGAVQEALNRALENGYLDDVAFTERFIKSRRESKSRQEIRFALRERGIRVDEDLLDELYPGEDEQAVALNWLLRRYPSKHGHGESSRQLWQVKRKLGQAMMRRGFSYESIDAALSRYLEWDDAE